MVECLKNNNFHKGRKHPYTSEFNLIILVLNNILGYDERKAEFHARKMRVLRISAINYVHLQIIKILTRKTFFFLINVVFSLNSHNILPIDLKKLNFHIP